MPVPSLSPLKLADFWQALQARLGGSAFWAEVELRWYAAEAVRTWNAVARASKKRVSLTTIANQAFYDLSTTNAIDLGYNYTDQAVVQICEYHLLEPSTYPTWSGTEQFNIADLLTAIDRRRNQFLLETAQVLTVYSPSVPPSPTGRVQINDAVLEIRRAAWQDSTTLAWTTLWNTDQFEVGAFASTMQAASGPQVYSNAILPNNQVELFPPPLSNGTLELVTISAGPLPTTSPQALGIPDDFAWVVKWGVLADLLGKDGPAHDPGRSAYCEKRWREGVEIARQATTVLSGDLSGSPLLLDSLFDFDAFRAGWRGQTGQPDAIALAGLNLVAFSRVPDGAYGAAFDAVVNTSLPVQPTAADDLTAVAVTRDAFDVIVDYAEHLALFKCGGAEFDNTQGHLDRFYRLASVYNDRMRTATRELMNRARVEESQRPMRING